MDFKVSTESKRQVVDITDTVQRLVARNATGIAVVTVLHTTAALTTADLDPGTDEDLLDALELMTPDHKWRHPHNPEHAPDHLLASFIGPSVTVPVVNGLLKLGTWQRVILIELDGPRERRLDLTVIKSG